MSIVRAISFSLFLILTLAAAHGEDKVAGGVVRATFPAENERAKIVVDNTAPRFIQVDATVNDPASDLTDRDRQTDPDITPAGEKDLVAAFTDDGSSVPGGNHGVGYAWSSDYGRSWKDAGALPASAAGDGGKPSLSYHRASSVVYLAARGADGRAMQVFRSVDKGRSFKAPVNAAPGFPSDANLDKPKIAVDNFPGTGNGVVYLCFSSSGQIVLTRSAIGGTAFAPKGGLTVAAGSNCHVTVSPDHQVNIFYARISSTGRKEIYLRRSTNRGGSLLREVRVAELDDPGDAEKTAPQAAVVTAPILGSSPERYPIFVVYSDANPTAADGKSDVFYVASLDNGATWSAPVQFNDVTAGDQDCASVAALGYANGPLMFGFCSRNQVWDGAFNVHQRGRFATVNAGGTIARIMPSFQVGPNAPNTAGSSIAGHSRFFFPVWADDRSGNDFRERQFDIRFGRLSFPLPAAEISLHTDGPSRLSLGRRGRLILTVSAADGVARDVFVKVPRVDGLTITQVRAAEGKCALREGTADCAFDDIPEGASKSIEVEVLATRSAAVRTFVASATTTSRESNTNDNSVSANVTVVNDGSAIIGTYSTGRIRGLISDGSTREFAVSVPPGTVANIAVRLVLFVQSIDTNVAHFSLISPSGRSIPLMPSPNYDAWIQQFGFGPTDDSCRSGLEFTDSAAKSIYEVTDERDLPESVRPGKSLMGAFAGTSSGGQWKLSVSVASSVSAMFQNYAYLQCFAVTILRGP